MFLNKTWEYLHILQFQEVPLRFCRVFCEFKSRDSSGSALNLQECHRVGDPSDSSRLRDIVVVGQLICRPEVKGVRKKNRPTKMGMMLYVFSYCKFSMLHDNISWYVQGILSKGFLMESLKWISLSSNQKVGAYVPSGKLTWQWKNGPFVGDALFYWKRRCSSIFQPAMFVSSLLECNKILQLL